MSTGYKQPEQTIWVCILPAPRAPAGAAELEARPTPTPKVSGIIVRIAINVRRMVMPCFHLSTRTCLDKTSDSIGSRLNNMSTIRRLQVFADPVRFLILDLITVHGELTTTQLGRMIPRARSGLDYHLNELESVDVIAGEGTGRSRSWHTLTQPLLELTDDEAGDDQLELAVLAAERAVVNRRIQRMRAWTELRRDERWDNWREVGISMDGVLPPMQPADLERLQGLISGAVRQFREELEERPDQSTDQPVFITVHASPLLADDQVR